MPATSVRIFDKTNKQEDYQFIAKDFEGKSVIGWIVIEKQWYSPESDWTYWMYFNRYARKYGRGGFSSKASYLGLERVPINPKTIRPYNQIEQIKYDLECGMDVRLEKEFYLFDEDPPKDNVLAIIHNVNEIPYELWE